MKKVLIFTITAGSAHNSAAAAVKSELEKRGAEVKCIDVLHEFCDDKLFIWFQEAGYGFACRYLYRIYNAFWRHYQHADPEKYYKSPVQKGLLKLYGKVLKAINDFQPDAIYVSHFIPAVMITNLRRLYPVPAKTFGFISDYVICPFWEAARGTDCMLIPDESFADQMRSKGFVNTRLLPYGLTVNEKFSESADKAEARAKLGLKEDIFTVFVMYGGGFWSGNPRIVKNIVRNLGNRPLQIIVANGIDKKGMRKIDAMKLPDNITLQNYAFSNEIDVFMSAADVIVGKAGGASTTESLNKILPMLCYKNLPEQEVYNVRMLVKEGAAKQYKSGREMAEILTYLMDNLAELEKMRENIKRIRRPHATARLADEIMECEAVYGDVGVDYTKVNSSIRKMLKKTKYETR